MLITYKLVKNALKFIMCFIAILIFYYYQSDAVSSVSSRRPQWRIFITNASKIENFKTQANFKYILIWNKDKFNFLKRGQKVFTENKCSYNNCYVTTHRNMISNDYAKFHAILFSGKKISNDFVNGYMELPMRRHRNQTYIFMMQKDAGTYPICHKKFDDFFNMTWSYKLDSDIIWTPFNILELGTGKVVAPNIKVQWATKNSNTTYKPDERLLNKEFFAVWNSTECNYPSRTQEVGRNLKMQSQDDDNIVDIIGPCGDKECTSTDNEECLKMLEDYSFYLALEDAEAEDYVSSEIVDAMEHYCVPVVFGGANYSRFLPPNSYIDVKKLGTRETAKLMNYLTSEVKAYFKYFEWRMTYKIVKNSGSPACALCEALNQEESRVKRNFRKWWNPDYEVACNSKRKRNAVADVKQFKEIN